MQNQSYSTAIGSVVDPWVTTYENLKTYMMTEAGIPPENADDYDWIKKNIKFYCDSRLAINILKQLKELHGF